MMSNNEIAEVIRQRVRSERDRYILYRRLLDGAKYREIADAMADDPVSVPTENSICKRYLRARKLIAPYLS